MNKKVALIIISILIVGIATGMLIIEFNDSNDYENINESGNAIQNAELNNIKKVIKKIDNSKDICYTIREADSEIGSYQMPFINIDSEDADNINKEINTLMQSHIIKVTENSNDGMWYTRYDYISNINDDILTVVLMYGDEYDYGIENVYNIDIYTGNQLTNEEMLILNNINAEEIDLKFVYDKMFLEVFDFAIPIFLKDEFIENKKIEGDSDIAYIVNHNYNAYSKYYDGKTLKDTNYYFGAGNNVFAEIRHNSPAGAVDAEMRTVVNINEILNDRGNNWYMIPDSDKKLINEDINREGLNESLNHLSNNELNIAYNEIFARHGHDFQSKDLKEHFSNMLWYKSIDGKQVTIEELNDVEKENVRIIKDEIEKRKVLLQKFNDGVYDSQPT